METPEILDRLEGVRPTAAGWQARCPSHDDTDASLSISLGDDGRTLCYCHAGCKTADVVRAAGLTMKSLMPTNGHQLLDSNNSNGSGKSRIVQVYDYLDEAGALVRQVCRFAEPKDFRQRAPDGSWKVKGLRVTPYRLPDIVGNPSVTVWVPEGEKDCDRLASVGLVATCNAMGAGKWRKAHAEPLKGRTVVVLPDNDDPGRVHAQQVAASCKAAGASVKILELPGLPDKGDVSDWLDAGHTSDELIALAEAAPQWKAPLKDRQKQLSQVGIISDITDLRSAAARTDAANARRLAQLYGVDLRWCEPWGKWLAWDSRRWAPDAERRVDAMAKEVADIIWNHTAKLLPDLDYATAKELTAFARYTAGARGVANMVTLAKSEPGIPILPATLDADPWLLNCGNGTVDLRTGTIRPHERGDLITTLCPTEYTAGAEVECPLWELSADRVFGGNPALTGFSQRLLGSAIVGTVVEHILPIFWGDGSNGKGAMLETVMDVIGPDFACKIAADVLLASKGDRHPTELADLHGKRLVVASETDDGRRLREGLLKEITGGDTIKARRMREDFWQFKPSHTLILLTNHRPTVRGTDHGIWRRLCLVPFTQKFWDADRGETGPPELQADKHLRDRLRAEHSGILRWLVAGCIQWQANGLQEPDEVRAATADYRATQDVLGAFLDECCIFGNSYTSKASDVRKRYQSWCDDNGQRPVNGNRFGEAMTERGVTRRKNSGIVYDGVALVE
jgi:putative DNA primase/helicase